VLAEKDALRKALDQQNTARKRKLEELNKQKKDLPINKDIKDTKKLIAANLEQLEREERAAETKIKTAATTGQDRGASKELQGIAAKKRIVREVRSTTLSPPPQYVSPTRVTRLPFLSPRLSRVVGQARCGGRSARGSRAGGSP
jgi:septal ring factor EnvC (AmiA/AmiB activator)